MNQDQYAGTFQNGTLKKSVKFLCPGSTKIIKCFVLNNSLLLIFDLFNNDPENLTHSTATLMTVSFFNLGFAR